MHSAKPPDTGNCRSTVRDLLRLSWPMLISQWAIVGNGVIDTFMAGGISVVDMAAVGVGASIQIMITMSLMGVLLGLPSHVAMLHGADKPDRIGNEVHQAGWIAFALCFVAVLLFNFPGPLLTLSNLQTDVEIKVRDYLAAAAWGLPAAFALRLFSCLSTGIGQPRPMMAIHLSALLLKFPLNAVFMHGVFGLPGMGAAGCAAASSLIAWLAVLAAWVWLLADERFQRFGLAPRMAMPDLSAITALLRLGLPIGLTYLADFTAFNFMALLLARFGPVISAAHQIAASLAVFVFMLPLSLGNATATLVGQALGKKDPTQARAICRIGIVFGIVAASVVSLSLGAGASVIAGLYSPDAAVIAAAIPLIVCVAFYHLADAVQTIATVALRAYRKSRIPLLIYSTSVWVIGLGGGVLLGLTDLLGPPRGAQGFWIAATASLLFVAVVGTLYLSTIARQNASRDS